MCAEGLANESARQVSTSYFKAAVMLMDKFIDPIRQEVAGGAALPTADPTTLAAQGFIDAEGSLEFHRLYSAILFLTHEVEEDGELPDLEVFGDGLMWGGSVFVHLLGQRQRFNLLDYSYQLLKLTDQHDADTTATPHIAQFLLRARASQQLNASIFDQLEAAMQKKSVWAERVPLPVPAPQ